MDCRPLVIGIYDMWVSLGKTSRYCGATDGDLTALSTLPCTSAGNEYGNLWHFNSQTKDMDILAEKKNVYLLLEPEVSFLLGNWEADQTQHRRRQPDARTDVACKSHQQGAI